MANKLLLSGEGRVLSVCDSRFELVGDNVTETDIPLPEGDITNYSFDGTAFIPLDTTIGYDSSQKPAKEKQLIDLSACVRMKRLWANSSPKSEFPPQEKNLPAIADFPWVMVIFSDDTGMKMLPPVFVKVGGTGMCVSGSRFGKYREFTVYSDRVSFEDAWVDGDPENGHCIPIQIYGVKGGFDYMGKL